jgi:RecQ family ATP-dependent DNA helicase
LSSVELEAIACPQRQEHLAAIKTSRAFSEIQGAQRLNDITYIIQGYSHDAYEGDASHDDALINKLREIWPNAFEWRPLQLKACRAVLEGQDMVLNMSCGAGKSICYQLPALLQKGVTVVLEPYRSNITDQVKELCGMGQAVEAFYQDRPATASRTADACKRVKEGTLKFIYTTVETFMKRKEFRAMLRELNDEGLFARCVIDEYDYTQSASKGFRPEWTQLNRIKEDYSYAGKPVPICAASAVGTPAAIRELVGLVGMCNVKLFASRDSIERQYLTLNVERKSSVQHAKVRIVQLLTTGPYAGKTAIVYCSTKKTCEAVSTHLLEHGVTSDHYHSGVPNKKQEQLACRWHANDGGLQVLVATNSFGRGVNNQHVRQVIHFNFPQSLSYLAQEVGRAGRDRQPATCTLFFDPNDRKQQESLLRLNSDAQGFDRLEAIYNTQYLDEVVRYCTSNECRMRLLDQAITLPSILQHFVSGLQV